MFLDFSRGIFYCLSDVWMLGDDSGVRLLTKLTVEGSCISAFISTKIRDGAESVMEASTAKDLSDIKENDKWVFTMVWGYQKKDNNNKVSSEKIFDNLISYTERLIQNHLDRKESVEYVNHLPFFNDKEGLIRKLHDQIIFHDMKIFNQFPAEDSSYNTVPMEFLVLSKAEHNLLSLIQEKIEEISTENANSLFKLIEEDCIRGDKNLSEYELNNLVLRTLLDDYGLSNPDNAYFFTSSEFYKKFKSNNVLRSLSSRSLREVLSSFYNKGFLSSYDEKINNHARVYFHKKKERVKYK